MAPSRRMPAFLGAMAVIVVLAFSCRSSSAFHLHGRLQLGASQRTMLSPISKSETLKMSVSPVRVKAQRLVVAAVLSSTGGGFATGALAGALHAVSGPDHLAALLPRIMGRSGGKAMSIGALWGIGHGISATIIGMVAYFFKGRLAGGKGSFVDKMGMWSEGLIGFSLIMIGLVGIKESVFEDQGHDAGKEQKQAEATGSASSPSAPSPLRGLKAQRAIFLNGILHGFSWDGAPSLAPALACTSWPAVFWFLFAYASGTMMAMSATTGVIGKGSSLASEALGEGVDLPKKLSIVSSMLAIFIGILFAGKSLFMS